MKNSFSIFQNILLSSYNDTLYIELLLYSFSKELRVFKREKKILFSINNSPKRGEETPRAIQIKLKGEKKKVYRTLELIDI